MRDLSQLNINERGKRVQRLPPSDEIINSFQSRLSAKLPENYVKLLRHSNGGHPELDSIEPVDRPGTRWAVNRFYFLDEDKTSVGSLWSAVEKWRKILGEHALPFAADGGGNQFFLDLNMTPPSVKICIHDQNFAIVDLAPSFDEFVDRLSVDPDMI
jgi:hypothetical protein